MPSSSVERIELSIVLFDGSEHLVHARPIETVGMLQQRLETVIGLHRPTLCCEGVLLSNHTTAIANRRESRRLTVWGAVRDAQLSLSGRIMRTQRASPCFASQRHARLQLEKDQLEERTRHPKVLSLSDLPRLLVRATPVVVAAGRTIPASAWISLAVWLAASIAASRVELLGPWLVMSATYLVYRFGFDEREAGTESAYTVFNNNMRALPGQLRAEDIQRDMMRGVGVPM
eukprot:CAMPEP_0115890674 /NCGR_PEP_ID=MMETSP0287-20121206/33471_1 /TAXON_ID=412157 /ORGANISM="Chrysochromulina rotalis, Strain UIO044" /LENGTH=230 /DNA_ID=CAMNT_0003347449 /DNA_START=8 /DNA_END=701 /DNA_ORIENTATION=+